MDRTERFYKIDTLLQANRVVPIDRLLRELEVSRATFKRDLEYLRDRLNAPIEWDRDERGYRYARAPEQGQHALPGLWFNASEAYALLMMQTLLSEMQPGLLKVHIEPLKARLRALIESGAHPANEVETRVRLLNVATRPVLDKHFEVVASALLARRRLEFVYYGRGRDESSQREVSPLQLLHYRGNWYLIAWCHMRKAIRPFAMDAIESATTTAKAAKELPRKDVEQFVGKGYGIFSGEHVQWATLRFSPERARWVSRESWHPEQKTQIDSEGHLLMRVPFTDARELSMDILRHGRHVEVVGPPPLRQFIQEELKCAVKPY
jgi:predicted DNA-binding transcriptional regulator YafY